MMLTAEVALEWFHASGARTLERLRSLVDHFSHTNALQPSEADEAYRQASAVARFDPPDEPGR